MNKKFNKKNYDWIKDNNMGKLENQVFMVITSTIGGCVFLLTKVINFMIYPLLLFILCLIIMDLFLISNIYERTKLKDNLSFYEFTDQMSLIKWEKEIEKHKFREKRTFKIIVAFYILSGILLSVFVYVDASKIKIFL